VLLPPGYRRTLFDCRVAGSFLAGTTTGSLTTAGAAWALSGFSAPAPETLRLGALVAGAMLVAASKAGLLGQRVKLPEAKRLIPAEVFGRGPVAGAYRFGVELGSGVRTYVPAAAPYVLLLAVLFGRLTLGSAMLLGLGFGFGRALPLMSQLVSDSGEGSAPQFRSGGTAFGRAVASVLVLAGAVSLAG
jgi:hypothetical protein